VDRPPEILDSAAVSLVRARPVHAAGLTDAVQRSLPELLMFMDWAADAPSDTAGYEDNLTEADARWDADRAYDYVIFDPATDEVIGRCGLMRRQGPGVIEIGYWVRSDRAGAGLATEAARLLTEAALQLVDVDRIVIHHDEANGASGRVAEKLGYTISERRRVEIDLPGETGVEVVWSLTDARIA